jgi:hypothetical protein
MEAHSRETSRLPHFLDNQLIDGSETEPYEPAALYLRKIPATHFC